MLKTDFPLSAAQQAARCVTENQADSRPLGSRTAIRSSYGPLIASTGERIRLQYTSGQWQAELDKDVDRYASKQIGLVVAAPSTDTAQKHLDL